MPLDKEFSDLRLVLINVYTRQRRFEEALLELRAYLDKNPKSPQRAALEAIEKQIGDMRNR